MIARRRSERVNWSTDLSLFRKQTMDQTVVMGATTEATLMTELDGRTVVIMHRDMDPQTILSKVDTEECFIIGGAITYSRFAPFLTHVYLTPHPLVFKSDAVPLFSHLERELILSFVRRVAVDEYKGIYQLQYKVVAVD